jgi:hypothetical protein
MAQQTKTNAGKQPDQGQGAQGKQNQGNPAAKSGQANQGAQGHQGAQTGQQSGQRTGANQGGNQGAQGQSGGGHTSSGSKARVGDAPGDLRETKPQQDNPASKDRGRDRNPGDMQRSGKDQNASKDLHDIENDVPGTGFDESNTPLSEDVDDTDEDDTDATDEDETDLTDQDEDEPQSSGGGHGKNPQPRTR